MIDTHSHMYSEEFNLDRSETIQRAKEEGIQHIILPNIDSKSFPLMIALEADHPNYCHACIGLHPTSVKDNYKDELAFVETQLKTRQWKAIGEIGIDLYWDKTYLDQQIHVFQQQVEWALKYQLPVIIHVRNAFEETMQALTPYKNQKLKGVFHSFTGDTAQATKILEYGDFLLGINGIVTFKNSILKSTLNEIAVEHLVLETDSPYLAPIPYRGKRNESAYLKYICQEIADIKGISQDEVSRITDNNARNVFKL
jgi:TatD DNase family protein